MAAKVVSVYRRGGLRLMRDTIRQLNRIYPVVHRGGVHGPVPVASYFDPAVAAGTLRTQGGSSRGRLLFIDWSTPRPDCDAGSITAFYLMKILVDIGFEVVFAPDDMLRLGHYTEALESLGITCLSVDRTGSLHEHLERDGAGYDYALICRAPFATKWVDPIRMHAPSAKIILNTADLYFLRDIREAELEGSAEKLEAALRWKEQELDIIRRCDHCIVMSDHEYTILAREAPEARVHLVPLMFVDIPGRTGAFEDRKDVLFIGGYLHKPNVDGAVWFCERVLPLVRARLPDLRVHLLGSNPTEQVQALAAIGGVNVAGYVEDLKPWFDRIRLSIAPLRFGAGIKGKLGTSLSFGVPSVATTIAVEGMHLVDGTHALVADDENAFAEQIIRLYTDAALWERLSIAGLKYVGDTYSLDAGLRRVDAFMREVESGMPAFPAAVVRDVEEYERYHETVAGRFQERLAYEETLLPPGEVDFDIPGWCAVCRRPSRFHVGYLYSCETRADGRPMPNWREHLACAQCGFNNRIRASLHAFQSRLTPAVDADIYITEQTTPLYQWMRAHYPGTRGSEYFGDKVAFGKEFDGLRNENIMATTWADRSFDCVLSFDVLEHVPDPLAAFRECRRILRPGGTLLWSAPFVFGEGWRLMDRNVIRAQHDAAGNLIHLMAPEYHGNPVDPEGGALCYQYFSLEALALLREAGFVDVELLFYWSPEFAYLGREQLFCIARNPE